jgi:hypothetical protein
VGGKRSTTSRFTPLIDDVGRLFDKAPQSGAAVLVAWRHDLDNRHDVPAPMSNHDAVGSLGVVDTINSCDHLRTGRCRRDRDAAFRGAFKLARAA